MYVLAGTRLTYTGNFDGHEFDVLAPMDAINSISAYLKNNYNLVVENYSFGAGFLNVVLNLISNMDRGTSTGNDDGVADIQSNVDDAWGNVLTGTGFGGGQGLQSSGLVVVTMPNDAQGASSDSYANTTHATDFIRNLLPTWLGGAPVTPDQLAARQAAAKVQIGQVGTNAKTLGANIDSTVAVQQAASVADAATIAAASNAAAKQQDTSNLNTWLVWGGVAVAAVLLISLAPTINRVAA